MKKIRGLALVLAVVAAGLSSCRDDRSNERVEDAPAEETAVDAAHEDDASTDPLSSVRVDEQQLIIELPAAAPSYVVTADVPPDWTVSATTGEELGLQSDSWELIGSQGETVTITVYDTRNTTYADPAPDTEHELSADDIAWSVLGEFTVEQIGPSSEFLIGSTEEVVVPEGFKGFDLLLVDVTSGLDQEASRFVVSLDGSFFITITTAFGSDADTADAAYELILDTATAVVA